MITQAFILLLAAIAAYVAYGLSKRRIMWRWIVAYWLVLTAKNVWDIVMQWRFC